MIVQDRAAFGGAPQPTPLIAGLVPSAVLRLAAAGDLARLSPHHAPPCPEPLLRLETAGGVPLNARNVIASHWHRPPYAMLLRLAFYAPGSRDAQILDEAVISTQGSRDAFQARVEATAMRLVEDALESRSRGAGGAIAPPQSTGVGGWVDYLVATWQRRLLTEWWSLGVARTALPAIVSDGKLGEVHWLRPGVGAAYHADPFPLPGTGQVLCEEMPMRGGVGTIVALSPQGDGTFERTRVVLDTGRHHSYPCTYQDDSGTYVLPESTDRGTTTLFRVAGDTLERVCAVAPDRSLADPTLFRHGARFWIACTDLDIGTHDNLCLLYADSLQGPWVPHRCTPVKIDIGGARPAGPLFRVGDALFRPGQDCSRTYGGGVAIHRIDVLDEENFRETRVTSLKPDPNGPFPDGLHTFSVDGDRVWVDGKRFVLDMPGAMRKLGRRMGFRGGATG